MIDEKKFRPSEFEQMALHLNLEEDEVESASISAEERTLRSEAARNALEATMGAREWADEYWLLRQAGWPWRVAAYIAWAASPKINRWPKTQDELARSVLGLTSDRQIATWRKKNEAIDDVIALMQAKPLLDHRRDVFQALAKSAADASFHGAQDRKTFLTMTGDYVPHQKVELERPKTDAKDYTEEELRKMAEDGSDD